MANHSEKNNFKKIFYNQKFLSLIGLAAIILISFPLAKNAIKRHNVNKEISDFKKEIAALENKGGDLKKVVSFLESDQFAEEQARLNLNLKKPGEELTIIKNGLSASATSGPQIFDILGDKNGESAKKLSNPVKWFNYFFK